MKRLLVFFIATLILATNVVPVLADDSGGGDSGSNGVHDFLA
jgi:archaellum component FlaG (FlaF/FlaG flagellin family)